MPPYSWGTFKVLAIIQCFVEFLSTITEGPEMYFGNFLSGVKLPQMFPPLKFGSYLKCFPRKTFNS